MKQLILPAFALLLVGLAAQATVSELKSPARDDTGWFLLSEGAGYKLVYGRADSDQVALMLSCDINDGFVRVYVDVEPDIESVRPINLGPVAMDPLSRGEATEMRLSLEDPGLWLLVDRGYLPVRTERGRQRIAANDNERQLANRFLEACARQHV